MKFLGVLVFLIADLVSCVFVAGYIGFGYALLWRILAFIIGLILMKSVGFSAFLHLKNLMQESNTPKEYIIGQGVTALSGILLMLPGFLSDGVFVLVTIFKTVIVNQIAKKFNLQMMQATFTQKGGQTEVKGRIIDQQ